VGPVHLSEDSASAAHLLPAVVVERLDDDRRADRFRGTLATMFKRQTEAEAAEEAVEHVGAERADCAQFVALGRVVQYNRCQWLRCRAAQYTRPGGCIELAMLGTAVNDPVVRTVRGRLVTIGDETDVACRVGEPVRAYGRVGDDGLARSDAARPVVGMTTGGAQILACADFFADVEQEARCGGEGPVKYVIASGLEYRRPERAPVRGREHTARKIAHDIAVSRHVQTGQAATGTTGSDEAASIHHHAPQELFVRQSLKTRKRRADSQGARRPG
jgi:hypothetical protein